MLPIPDTTVESQAQLYIRPLASLDLKEKNWLELHYYSNVFPLSERADFSMWSSKAALHTDITK